MLYFALAFVNVPSLIMSGGAYWWNAIAFGFCLGLGVANWRRN